MPNKYFCEYEPPKTTVSHGKPYEKTTNCRTMKLLRDIIGNSPQGLDADVVLRIATNLVDALIAEEAKGIIHSDVMPEDVVVCGCESVRIVKDEGVRTPCKQGAYLAPECWGESFEGDVRGCIFSVGVIVHEMLTGKTPRRVADGDAKIHVSNRPGYLLSHIAEFLDRSLAEKREARYANLLAFKDALGEVKVRRLENGENCYQLLQYVGRGAICEVFKARLLRTGQTVAIKHLLRKGHTAYFHREATVLQSLNDSLFCRFIDSFKMTFVSHEEEFLVVSFLSGMPGATVRDLIGRSNGSRPDLKCILRAFISYSRALSTLHHRRLYGHNIKPSNLYYCENDPGKSQIIDLNFFDDSNQREAVPVQLDLTAPEAVRGGCRDDARCDIFALGLSLYEALTGKEAYPRLPTGVQGVSAFYERAKNLVPPTFDDESVKSNPELLKLLTDMTNPKRELRLHDAVEVTRRLKRILQRFDLDLPTADAAKEEQLIP